MASVARDLSQDITTSPYIPTRQHPPAGHTVHDHSDEQDECPCPHQHDAQRNGYSKDVEAAKQSTSTLSGSSLAEQMIMPFLIEHMPSHYDDVGAGLPSETEDRTDTEFSYRQQLDLKSRRKANEPSMNYLQEELAMLSQSDQQAISHVWSLFSAAPPKHRNLMLQGIITQCRSPQLEYITANVRDLIKVDFLSALPAELGFKILCYLDTTSLCSSARVSQRWRSLADDDVVWHRMCEQHIDRRCTKCGWGLPLLEQMRLRLEKRQIQLRATGRGLNEWSPDITPVPEEIPAQLIKSSEGGAATKRALEDGVLPSEVVKRQCTSSVHESIEKVALSNSSTMTIRKRPWKDVYKDRFRVGTNWKYGRFTTKVFRGHTNGVMCLQFDDNVLITGSYDTTAKVWDLKTGKELRTLSGHASGIRCLQFDEGKLFTGSLDNTIKLWDWRTGQCRRTFPAHTAGIVTLHFNGPLVASGSMDHTIRVWNLETQQTFLLRGHTDWVNCVKLDLESRTLFSASDDLTVRLWDLDTHQCIHTFEGHVGQVQQVLPLPMEFELDERRPQPEKDDDASSTTSDPAEHNFQPKRDTPELEMSFWPHDPERPAPPRYMLTGALDSTIRLWDVHFNPHKHAAEAPNRQESETSTFKMLPTDPLTNSHTPRAQSCLRTFFGHVEGIWALAADHLRLISGSEDKMMKVWDPRTGKCERTFTGHTGPVTCAWLSDSRVASGSEDSEVRMLCFGDP